MENKPTQTSLVTKGYYQQSNKARVIWFLYTCSQTRSQIPKMYTQSLSTTSRTRLGEMQHGLGIYI